ncbi:MAG: nucleotidyl transferase AbiEii/AbiGii toxin family protein [Rectinemataceae bacterium]
MVRSEAVALALQSPSPAGRTNILREYLQAITLRSLHESRAFESLSFVGGTALRFLYDLPRFSEDLDFSLETEEGYKPREWMAKLLRDVRYQGFDVEAAWNDRKTVHTAWLRFAGLPMDIGIADRPDQKLSIKLEIDTKPPAGASTETRLLNRHVLFSVRHHDLPSLMAGKVHALLAQPYTKGRDWYDLVWYRSRRPPVEPNMALLAAADWRTIVADRAAALDFNEVVADVVAFLERPEDAALLSPDAIARLLA